MTWLIIAGFFLMIFMAIEPYIIWIVLFGVLFLIIIVISVNHELAQDNKIVSATVVNRTQMTKEVYRHSGFSVGLRGNPRFHWRVKNVPTHIEVKVDVVYEDGKHRQLTLVEGSERYNKILSICAKRKEELATKTVSVLDSEKKQSSETKKQIEYIDIKTNQLVQGIYITGEVIPEGNYDFRWIWGSGSIHKYIDHTTTLGASNLFKWVGNTRDYEERVLMNVICKSGEYLHIDGNLIVEIRKSNPVKIDL